MRDEWKNFFGTLEECIEYLDHLIDNVYLPKKEVKDILNELISMLLEEDVLEEIDKATKYTDDWEKRQFEFLVREMRLYVDAVRADIVNNKIEERIGIRLLQAKTIKKSLGRILKLPKRLEKLLDVRDELLNLIKI